MSKIAIISPFKLPVPAVKGGGIENLLQLLIDENETQSEMSLTVYGKFDRSLIDIQTRYKNTQFNLIQTDTLLDQAFHLIVKLLKRLKIARINRHVLIAKKMLAHLNREIYDQVVLVNNLDLLKALFNKTSQEMILYLHNDIFYEGRTDYYSAVRSCSKILTVSEYIRSRVLTFKDLAPNKVCVLRNGIDVTPFQSLDDQIVQTLKDQYGLHRGEIVILYSGRVVYEKGVRELLLAFKMISEKYPVKLMIAGGIWYNQNLENSFTSELAQLSEAIKDKIVFTGYVDYNKIHGIYQMADIVVVPTMHVEEAASLVVLEAMAAGKPLIITDSGGMPEYASADCSIVVKRNSDIVENLAHAMEQLINDPERREEMGQSGLVASNRFSKGNYYKGFVEAMVTNRDRETV